MGIRNDIEAIQAESEGVRDLSLPENVRGEGRTPSVVHSLRLPADVYNAIDVLAQDSGVPTGALIRGWVLAAYAAEKSATLRDAIDRLIADADFVRCLATHPAA